MPRQLNLAIMLLALAPLGACSVIAVPTNLVSHQVCSATFVSGVEPERFYREAVATDVKPVGFLIRHRVDRVRLEVTSSFAGLVHSRAVYRGQEGCLVLAGARRPAAPIVLDPTAAPARLPPIGGPEVVVPSDPRLAAALDRAFAEPERPPHRSTKAVVILHDGRIVAERYAPGYGVETPITGWSMTKSVTNAMLGVLVRQGQLDMFKPAPVAAWAGPNDPRHAITPDNLLRMESGLDLGESENPSWKSAFDPSARMLFAQDDMAAFAERRKAVFPPGTHFAYADGSTMILSQILKEKAGGDAAGVLRFAHHEVFDKLGMSRVTWEFDAVGTPLGAGHLWAPARDWARLGMLYIDDGVVGGERILPVGWVDYSARVTPGSEAYGYGAGFWTNRPNAKGVRIRPTLPADSFMARGNHGQALVIIPSAKLVIVRMGDAYTPYGDGLALTQLVRDALAVFSAD
ncbi:serine hydrolase [Phenylobacterium sp.]|jgi:hypothetical protein|uniref:serine hydrolase domain-containing protein n=1 Tax=Phenylobacterium sp. TaxID=1871053 RepID=UPI002E364399|nr:serine hydrolase [Phenylobacterium sp.]HEX4709054.1 serine hydrolase [Phenylobacterium sp.]